MLELFEECFEKYGHVHKYPNKDVWKIYAYLDDSFDFLLEKPKRIQNDIKDGGKIFMSFLAGYADGEGTLTITPNNKKNVIRWFIIGSEDIGILRDIKGKLTEDGYHLTLHITARKGEKRGYGTLSKDLWRLGIYRKDEVLKLLRELPLRHKDKLDGKS